MGCTLFYRLPKISSSIFNSYSLRGGVGARPTCPHHSNPWGRPLQLYKLPSVLEMLKFILSCIALCFLLRNWLIVISVLLVLSFSWLVLIINFNFGVINLIQLDNLAYLLRALSLWISALIIIIRYYMKYSGNFFTIFTGLILLILVFLTLRFRTSNLLIFYIAFERTLIPIFIMIMG